jgi:hypothetical protein
MVIEIVDLPMKKEAIFSIVSYLAMLVYQKVYTTKHGHE